MAPQTSLADKLAAYRSAFELACSGLFGGGVAVTLEYEHEDSDAGAAPVETAPTLDTKPNPAAVKREIGNAIRSIAEDFAREFNQRLTEAAQQDPSVELVAPKYEMGPDHVAELEELLTEPAASLLASLDAGDLEGARRVAVDAWEPLEKRIRSKWQAYFVLTFQDVSVERKAAHDRRHLQTRFDPGSGALVVGGASPRSPMPRLPMPREAPELVGPVGARSPRSLSPWIAVAALLALAVVSGWLLMRGHRRAAAAPAAQGASGR
jgi:hypothetical protein